jgi:hypothetical protein
MIVPQPKTMMRHLLPVLAALLLAGGAGQAEAASCRTTAQLNRDQCSRENSGNRARSRQCLDNYLLALDNCEDGGYDPINPPPGRGRNDPLNPRTPRSNPVTPQVNPRPTPVQPRIQPRVQPVKPYDRRLP